MELKKLLEKIAREKGGYFVPEDIDHYLSDFIPDVLYKSGTLQIACDVTDEEMEVLYSEAYNFYDQAKYSQSADAFRWLVLFNPFLSRYWMGLGASQQLLKLYDKALHSYAVAALLDASSPYPHLYAYDCCIALGFQEDAVKALNLAAERAHYDLKYVALKNEIATLQKGFHSCTQH